MADITLKEALDRQQSGHPIDILELFAPEEELTTEELEYLGDPLWYTKIVLANPPVDDQSIKVYRDTFKVDLKSDTALMNFWQSETFIDWYCSIDPLMFMEQKLGHVVKPHHVEWAQAALKLKSIVIFSGRDSGKSQFFSRDLSLWDVHYKYRKEILLMSDTRPQAIKMIDVGADSIKKQVENNLKLSWLMPNVSKKNHGAWSKQAVEFSNGCRIEGLGFGSRSRGQHPDKAVIDDALSDQNTMTEQLREQTWNYYKNTIVPMAKKGTKIIVVGTAQHQDDLLHRLSKSKLYFVKKYQALDESTGKAIWEERHDAEFYKNYRETFGELSFQKEYQCNPTDDSLSLFPEALLVSCLDENLSYVSSYKGPDPCFVGADFSQPGGSKYGDGDYTVYPVGAMNTDGVLRILYMERFRDSPNSKEPFLSKQLDYLQNISMNFNIQGGNAEAVGFQSIYTKDAIQREMKLPINAVLTSRSQKADLKAGIPHMRTMMERGLWKFPYKNPADKAITHMIMGEFKGATLDKDGKIITMTKHDDILMGMWFMSSAAISQGPTQGYLVNKSNFMGRGSRLSGFRGRGRR